jgi:putative chitobiose transport system permease protein
LRAAFFMPVVTPTIVAAMAWRIVLNEESGVINTVLGCVGIGPIRWLTEWPWTLVGPMLVTLWKGFGFYMLVFVAALLAIPKELREAAEMDGAGRWRAFTTVTLPELRPAMALVLVVSSISALKVFEELFVTVRGVPMTHQTVVPLVYRVAFEEGNYGLASAMGVVLFVVILGMSLWNMRLSRRAG